MGSYREGPSRCEHAWTTVDTARRVRRAVARRAVARHHGRASRPLSRWRNDRSPWATPAKEKIFDRRVTFSFIVRIVFDLADACDHHDADTSRVSVVPGRLRVTGAQDRPSSCTNRALAACFRICANEGDSVLDNGQISRPECVSDAVPCLNRSYCRTLPLAVCWRFDSCSHSAKSPFRSP
jgi:hypothetical protein